MQFKRRFTTKGVDVFDTVKWVKSTALITDVNGEIVFELDNAEFPEFYSQTSINIIASKYFIPKVETSLKQLIHRVVQTTTRWGVEQGYFSEKDSIVFYQEVAYMLLHQMFSFNSPVWFNIGNPYTEPQASACYILSAEDTMESILENFQTEMEIFRRGSGAGTNRSSLRSSKEKISRGGYAAGPCAYMKVYDVGASVTKSAGLLRRAAKMEILNIDHVDVSQFIKQKSEQEKRAKALIAAGWDSRFDNPDGAYGSAFYQSSNQSIRVFNSFMHAAKHNEKWALLASAATSRIPITSLDQDNMFLETSQGKFYKYQNKEYCHKEGLPYASLVVKVEYASDLFHEASVCTWEVGDPGFQFHDTIQYWNTCKVSGNINASNPCSEYLFLDDTSCNLASLNLLQFYKPSASATKSFNTASFTHAIQLGITAMDIFVSKAFYPTKKIAERTKMFRTLGIGYTNAGALILQKGLEYGSEEAACYLGAITALMHYTAYIQSSKLANLLGEFPAYALNKSSMINVLMQHAIAGESLKLKKALTSEARSILSAGLVPFNKLLHQKSPKFRNAQVTVLAPTGTISFMMDCETTGIEPVMGLITYKKLVGGGEIKQTVPSVKVALQTLHYTPEEIKSITENISNGVPLSQTGMKPEHFAVFRTAIGSENTIHVAEHLRMMGAVQPFLSGAISKTLNLPNTATVEDVKNTYITAHTLGLKAVAIYRDGCKFSQPVSTTSESAEVSANTSRITNQHVSVTRRKLPSTRNGVIHKFRISDHTGYIKIGKYDSGEIGEVFLGMGKEGNTVSGFADQWATLFSIALQYGVPLQVLANAGKNTRFEPSGITDNASIRFTTSPLDYVSKFLESFCSNADKEVVAEAVRESLQFQSTESQPGKKQITSWQTCSRCGGLLIPAGSCYTCSNCGDSTGCSA